MKKAFLALALILIFANVFLPVYAASEYNNWNEIADDMNAVLDESLDIYINGDATAAKDKVDEAYFGFYEKLGFERAVLSHISGERAATVEYQFSAAKKAMLAGNPAESVSAELETLKNYLREDANSLDGVVTTPVTTFLSSLLIIVREGFEAILVVGAIIAYLIKSGNKSSVKAVYVGILFALAVSAIVAVVLNSLNAAFSANQEIIEGITIMVAVAVLFYVSNWMLGKAEAEAWGSYIQGKVQSSIAKSSLWSMIFAAFLAVFREGAETILFYQALLADSKNETSMIWAGFGVGCVALILLFILFRVFSIKIPLKPFFVATSALLLIMCFSFVGTGVKEFQEGGLVSVTMIDGMFTFDLLGIYPTYETLIPQAVLLLITVVTVIIQVRGWKKKRAPAA